MSHQRKLISWRGASILFASLYLGDLPSFGSTPVLHDTGRFRVGSKLGEERAGFSGRTKVIVLTNPEAADWPAIEACLSDPILEPDMDYFTGVLINEVDEPDVEGSLKERGFQVILRALDGGVRGLLEPGFTCLDLVRTLESARERYPVEPEKSPIYAVLLENPGAIERVALDLGCARAAEFVGLFEEFEGKDSPAVITAKESLAKHCSTFLRGDPNQDGRVDLSDAIYALGFLFLGDPLSICMDAADSNDDGRLDISDALYLLTYLFVCSSSPPPEPFPLRGPDPTEDELGC